MRLKKLVKITSTMSEVRMHDGNGSTLVATTENPESVKKFGDVEVLLVSPRIDEKTSKSYLFVYGDTDDIKKVRETT